MTTEKQTSFGQKLLDILSHRGWSQKQLSERSRLSNAAVSRVISGKRTPSLKTLHALSEGLDMTISELTEGTEHQVYFEKTSTSLANPPVDPPANQPLQDTSPDTEELIKALEQSLLSERERNVALDAQLNEAKLALAEAREQANRSKAARDKSLRFANEYYQEYKAALARIAKVREELDGARGEPLDMEQVIRRLADLEERSA